MDDCLLVSYFDQLLSYRPTHLYKGQLKLADFGLARAFGKCLFIRHNRNYQTISFWTNLNMTSFG